MIEKVLLTMDQKMQTTLDVLKKDLSSIRTGRASPAMVENVRVEYGEATMPINHIAGISTSGVNLLIIQPWDPGSLKAIEKAILKSNLGLTPNNDGICIRLTIPPLSNERRQELIKIVKARVEEGKIAIRNLRRDASEELKKLEKDKEISQDDQRRAQDKVEKITDSFITLADKVREDKEEELLEV
ncbi:MAG: ribosome recycling factor [Dehalococcoidales bacterium]|nr:ribosome recycling factor [Dehalococcoidales bacterium]